MIHMGLSLLTVALESGADYIPAYSSLMCLVKDDMCKNLIFVSFVMVFSEIYNPLFRFRYLSSISFALLGDAISKGTRSQTFVEK